MYKIKIEINAKVYYYYVMNKNKTEIVPLGQNCMPRTILTRWGVKSSKIFGELTYPFDLAVFETREITNSIKDDFKEFFYNLNYREDRQIWVKEPDCIEFVHDKTFKKKDKNKLIEKYINRINNFRNVINNPHPILFVQILGDCSDIENLYECLKEKRKEKPFRFIVIDTQNITDSYCGIDILKLPFPSEEYKNNWWKKEYYSTKEGMLFEKQIADFCLKVIEEMII